MYACVLCALTLDITHSSWSVDCKGWGMRSHKYRKGKEVKKQPPRCQTALRPRIMLGENWAWQWKVKYIWPLNTTGLNYMGPLTHGFFFFSIANIAVHFCSWLNPQMQKANHKLLRNFWLLYNWPHPNFLHCSRVNCISNSLWTFKYEGKGYLKLRYRRPWEGKFYPRGHRGCVSGRGRGEVAYKSGLLSTLLTFPHPFSLFPLQAASLSCHHL